MAQDSSTSPMAQGQIRRDAKDGSGRFAVNPSTRLVPRRIVPLPRRYIGSRSDGSGSCSLSAVRAPAYRIGSSLEKTGARLASPQGASSSRQEFGRAREARRNSRAQSLSISTYVALRIEPRAINTQSQPDRYWCIRSRTASRIRRLTRFRTTALPILRLTEKPKRL